MNLVGQALWYIESHFAEEISLAEIAAAGDVSRFHMARAFGLATGRPVMRYVRGRRLTEAARSLAHGALEPRRESGGALLIAGLRVRYSDGNVAGIPMQWQRFIAFIGAISGRADDRTYGVCCDFDEAGHFDYVCGVVVTSLSDLDPELSSLRIAPRDYLVFRHRGHVSGIHGTWRAIMEHWLPASGIKLANAPNFERYAADFDARTGEGGAEIWVPIQAG